MGRPAKAFPIRFPTPFTVSIHLSFSFIQVEGSPKGWMDGTEGTKRDNQPHNNRSLKEPAINC